jgi:hypothetical protein
LLLTGGAGGSIDDLVAATDRGLLLTCLWYIRLVDPTTLLLTGLTRDGVYLVERGEVVAEVDHNFRFNYSPLDVLRRATQVGATERTLPRSGRTGSRGQRCPRYACPSSSCRRCRWAAESPPLSEIPPALVRMAVAFGCCVATVRRTTGVGDAYLDRADAVDWMCATTRGSQR